MIQRALIGLHEGLGTAYFAQSLARLVGVIYIKSKLLHDDNSPSYFATCANTLRALSVIVRIRHVLSL